MSAPSLLFERDGAIATITLNRPDVGNAIDLEMTYALRDAAIVCDTDPTIRCVVLTGTGKMFCAGGDIASMLKAGDKVQAMVGELARALHTGMSCLARMNKPLVVLVNGHAAGAGYGMALSGDIVLCARSTTFTAAYGQLGVSPDGGLSWILPRLVGLRRAQEIIIGSRRLTAEEAESIGLVTRTVDDEALAEEGAKWAVKLAAGPIDAIGRTRALLLSAYDNNLETQLELEARGIAATVAGPEGQEGVAAFLAKRAPNFGEIS